MPDICDGATKRFNNGILDSSKQVASAGVIVDAKDESATAFYKKYGFVELPKIEKCLFLPMGTVEQLFR
jgi:hypothetical protein